MLKRVRWWGWTPNTYQGALLDAVAVYAVVLLTAAVIDDEDGWRGGLVFGAVFAGFRLLLSTFSVWNSREPEPR